MEPCELSSTLPENTEFGKETTLTPETAESAVAAEEKCNQPQDNSEDAVVVTDDSAETAPVATSKADVIGELELLAARDATEIATEDISRFKQLFYAMRHEELRREKEEFLAKGNEESAFAPLPDADEEKFKELLNTIKTKKAEHRAAIDAEREKNYELKREIVAEINSMSEDTDNVHRHFPRVKELQTAFKEIGEVSPTVAADLWKSFQEAVEHFYDQHKINKELRDYDFKKNLAEKQLIIDEACKLNDEADVITAFKRLQELHDKWREIGPVSKEVREEIWQQFKDASALVNKRYQAHFEERKARERENETAKTSICERVEALDFSGLKTYSAWDSMTKEIMQAQEDWKKLGFASRKMNNALFARFRQTCDRFFEQKAEFFRQMKDSLAENLAKKTALCERAEALKDSTDWRKATDEFVAMQKEWKTIGTVAKKHSDAVWRRFLDACDYFFEQKKKNTSGTRKAEQANLKAKRDIIERLKQIDTEGSRDEILKTTRELQAEWQQTGHVPFHEKDKVYDEYRKVVDAIYDSLDISRSRARMENFESSISRMDGDENKLYRERERLVRAYEQRKSDLQTYENNLGFFSSKSKSGDSMMRDMERKIQRLKDDIEDLRKKIEVIDRKI